MSNLFSQESPLTAVNLHRIDVVLPRQTVTFPLIDSAKGGDIVNFIKSRGFQHFVICRNSKSGDFYDILYCDDNDQQIQNLILQQINQQQQQQMQSTSSSSPANFLTRPLKEVFIANTMVNTLHQRMALFVFALYNFKEMLFFRSFSSSSSSSSGSNFQNSQQQNNNNISCQQQQKPKHLIYFRIPEKTTFRIKLSTGLIINIKCVLTVTVNELAKIAYDKMVAIYSDSAVNIKAFRFFKLSTRFGPPSDPKSALKDEKVVLDSLQYQRRNPNLSCFLLIQTIVISSFDKKAVEFTRELDLCKIPSNDEIRCFNSSISLIRSEIEQKRIEKWQSNPLLSRMRISDSEPPLPNIDINEYMIVVKAELRASKLKVEANIMTIRATLNTTADEVIEQLMNRLRSLRRSSRNSIDSCPFGNNSNAAGTLNSPIISDRPMSVNYSISKAANNSGLVSPLSFMSSPHSPIKSSSPPANPLGSRDICPEPPAFIPRPPSNDPDDSTPHPHSHLMSQSKSQSQFSAQTLRNNESVLPVPTSSFKQPQFLGAPNRTPLSQPPLSQPPPSTGTATSVPAASAATTETITVNTPYGVALRRVEKPPIPSPQQTTQTTPQTPAPEVMSLKEKIAAFQGGIVTNTTTSTAATISPPPSTSAITTNTSNANNSAFNSNINNNANSYNSSVFNTAPAVRQPQSQPQNLRIPLTVQQQQQQQQQQFGGQTNSSRKSSFANDENDNEDSESISTEEFYRFGANINSMRRKFSEAESLVQFASNSNFIESNSDANTIPLMTLPINYANSNDSSEDSSTSGYSNISAMNYEQFVLVLSGYDEVLSGNRPLKEFVSVRQLVCAQQQVFSVHLVEKEEIIASINKNEMSKKDSLVEASREILTWPIMLIKPPNPQIGKSGFKENIGCIQHISIPSKLTVEVQAILNLKAKEEGYYFVKVCLIHGTKLLCNPSQTRTVSGKECVMFNELVEIGLPLNRIPREARIAFTLYKDTSRTPLNSSPQQQMQMQQQSMNMSSNMQQIGGMQSSGEIVYAATTATKSIEAVATYNFTIFKFSGWMNNGDQMKRMWRNKDIDFFLACESNVDDEEPLYIMLSFSRFKYPVSFIPFDVPKELSSASTSYTNINANTNSNVNNSNNVNNVSIGNISPQTSANINTNLNANINAKSIPGFNQQIVQKLMNQDPLTYLSRDEMIFLWHYRANCTAYPELLPLVLSSIDYTDPQQVREIPLLLARWSRPSPLLALTLLDAKFADTHIRSYAVECIEDFTDSEMMLYLLQLVQALKYELNEDSSLARFLIRRGLNEPKLIGHQLFWQLMSEAHLSHIRTRFSLILVNFMYGIGAYRDELIKGFKFTQDLVKLNREVQNIPYNSVQETFRERLQRIEIPNEFHLPMDPRLIVESFIIEKCKVMNSKKKPFWLTFKNATPFSSEPVLTMFKVGDDLRQDQLILQIMKVMEHLWRSSGKDFQMRCYGVLPTGLNQGFIEVVPNSITESDLQVEQGTFNKTIYTKFLTANNVGEADFLQAKETFLMSSVGYAVSTCVLGVADRHPGNIMIQPDGHFFHIDFGHFLGNFKTKAGVQCEDAPFHFIGAYMNLFGGKKSIEFAKFLAESGIALNVLRHNARLLITLLVLMLGTGIPELQTVEDIYYFRNKLFLDLTDQGATEKFEALTLQSLKSWKTLLKAKVHNAIVK